MTCTVVFPLLVALAAPAPDASGSPLWGGLAAGPHAVGFRQIERYDYARPYWLPKDLDGRARSRERARPMRISLWYPAQPTAGAPMTFGDYLALLAGETRLGAPTPAEVRVAKQAFFQAPILRELSPEQTAKLEAMPSRAVAGAPPAQGRFPLILYSLGSAALAHVTPEFLASHGYVVAQMPRLGLFAGLPRDTPDVSDIDTKVRDMDFIINALHEFASADVHNMGAVGFSAGGRWGLAEVMKHADVRALVSLDSVMLFDDAVTKAWTQTPFFNLDLVRVPVLHLIRKEWVAREDAKLWQGMRHADRWYLRFDDPGLDHFDFQSIGYATTLVGGRPDKARAIAATFALFHRYTLAFFDAHLKGDSKARALLGRDPKQNGAPAGLVAMTMTKAQPAPMTLADFFNSVDEGGVDHAVAAYRRQWKARREPPIAEAALNLSAYVLLGSGRAGDAIKLFRLNLEAFPQSANVYDSLADAYLATGDRKQALELTRRAFSRLDTDSSLTPERKRLLKQSIDDKLRRLQ